jgi:hypothetical protein
MRIAGLSCGLLACAALGLGGCGGDSATVSTTPTATTQSRPATTPSTATATTPTQTGARSATITQVEAKAAVRQAASRQASRGGIDQPPDQWDARCTAVGGGDRAGTWRCQASSLGGQCSGALTASAAAPDVARTRDVRVACGE